MTLHCVFQVTVGQGEKVSLPVETEEREEQEVSLDSSIKEVLSGPIRRVFRERG